MDWMVEVLGLDPAFRTSGGKGGGIIGVSVTMTSLQLKRRDSIADDRTLPPSHASPPPLRPASARCATSLRRSPSLRAMMALLATSPRAARPLLRLPADPLPSPSPCARSTRRSWSCTARLRRTLSAPRRLSSSACSGALCRCMRRITRSAVTRCARRSRRTSRTATRRSSSSALSVPRAVALLTTSLSSARLVSTCVAGSRIAAASLPQS